VPITLVLNSRGQVLHNCRELGCEVTWDGFDVVTGESRNPDGFTLPDTYEQIDEQTVQLKPAPEY
jgi:hypothetical protein